MFLASCELKMQTRILISVLHIKSWNCWYYFVRWLRNPNFSHANLQAFDMIQVNVEK
jgi:hypothetical protein